MRSKKIVALFAVWLILGIGLLVTGFVARSTLFVLLGIVALFGGGFVVAVICVILMFLQAKREVDAEDDPKKAEQYALKDINSSAGYNNRMANGMRMFKHVIRNWRVSDNGDKIKGCLFLFTFIACCILFVVFISLGKPMWGIISWGVGVGMILIAFIVVKIKEHLSLSTRSIRSSRKKGKHDPTAKILKVPVRHCLLSSQSGSGTSRSSYISSVTYKVILEIDGKDVTCYSREFYNDGEIVNVLSYNSGKRIFLCGKTDAESEKKSSNE